MYVIVEQECSTLLRNSEYLSEHPFVSQPRVCTEHFLALLVFVSISKWHTYIFQHGYSASDTKP